MHTPPPPAHALLLAQGLWPVHARGPAHDPKSASVPLFARGTEPAYAPALSHTPFLWAQGLRAKELSAKGLRSGGNRFQEASLLARALCRAPGPEGPGAEGMLSDERPVDAQITPRGHSFRACLEN